MCGLNFSLFHPVLTSSTYPSELLTSCFDLFQIREISFALVFLTLSAQSVLQLVLLFILSLLNGLISILEVLHGHLLFLIAPIDIADALYTRMKVIHMFGPVQTPHYFSTRTYVANLFFNPLYSLLSLANFLCDLLWWMLNILIARVSLLL